jgi:ABC-2 type transport system ATP-binding protein
MAIIEIRDLVKRFGAVEAVSGLSFDVEQGSVTGFLGANGAGKTTTLRALLGLVSATSGTAHINGHPYTALSHPLRQVGAALETSGFYPGRTARDHLRILALAADVDSSRADDALDIVDLSSAANRRIGGFSLGMRQRLGLAGALIANPEILILDEPANGLDPEGVRWLRDLLRGYAADGGTVLVSSHILAEVAQTVDHVVIIDHGRLVRQGSLAEVARSSDLETTFFNLTDENPR